MSDTKGLETKTFYEVLGVPHEASVDQIREVYREIARVYHPDSNFYSEIVPQKASHEQVQVFKIITAAYNTLVDPNKRAEYDHSIEPLLNLRKKVKDWESESEAFTPSRPLESPRRATPTRRMTATFGRREFLEEQDSVVDETPPPLSGKISFWPIVWLGIIGGMLTGAVVYYVLTRTGH
jgi:curved DNA-binding protein CbpA